MITNYEQINNYPENPDQDIINDFVDFVIIDSINEARLKTLEKLEELANKQYHLYNEPNTEIKKKIKSWIIANWISPDDDELEIIMCIVSGFAMNKELYQMALEKYNGESKAEFEITLTNSKSKNINPWWDLK